MCFLNTLFDSVFEHIILTCNIFQIQYIKEHSGDKNKQQIEFNKLLEEEVRLLNEVDRKRNKIRKEAHDKHMDQMLDKMGAPIKWIGYKSNEKIHLNYTRASRFEISCLKIFNAKWIRFNVKRFES